MMPYERAATAKAVSLRKRQPDRAFRRSTYAPQYEAVGAYPQPIHQFVGLSNALLRRFAVFEHALEFHSRPLSQRKKVSSGMISVGPESAMPATTAASVSTLSMRALISAFLGMGRSLDIYRLICQ
jgi:hypothetical protein